MNRFHQLYLHRKSIATKPFAARGKKVVRCVNCQVAQQNCICSLKVSSSCNAGFVLILHDSEILKPSNTGRLIGDICEACFPFIWSRTEVDQTLLDILADPQWFPMVVFPEQYAQDGQQVFKRKVDLPQGRKPLFIILDGSWREARRMFRKSPYLANLPLVTLPADFEKEEQAIGSRYALRKAQVDNHLATAEVAARLLSQQGEVQSGKLLDLWFDVFSWQYQKSVCQNAQGNANAIEVYQDFVVQHGLAYEEVENENN